MAVLHVTPTIVRVELTLTEKLLGLLRDVTIRRGDVTAATGHPAPVDAVHGLRTPGFAIPGRRKVGTWRRPGWRAEVAVTAGVPAVRLELAGPRHDQVIISHSSASTWAATLQPASSCASRGGITTMHLSPHHARRRS